ncbi:Putative Fungal specific transcription factor [[Torrubiella] hemipterigena]|uniref:Putative Fungal specific transcription factor n=1 Tax=[Torrubiella] hemipterigena TaxID=1531966 RepID=A0A0A1TAK2_9HYPO|nr:Putative Fungal specific transcription factor [[Torrubiella] hemipterigena]
MAPSGMDAASLEMQPSPPLQIEASAATSLVQPSQQASTTKPSTVNPGRQREKPHLSCNLCRKRKLRCDRKQPCSSCASRDIPCSYVQGGAGVAGPTLHDRLVQLERLILLQMPLSQGSQGQHPAAQPGSMHMDGPQDGAGVQPADSRDVPSERGSLHVGGSEQRYVGGEHWAAILYNITDFKDQLERQEDMSLLEPPGASSSGNAQEPDVARIPPARRALLLYSCPRPASREEILAALPPKITVDRYLSRYFTCLELASCTIHGPTFLQEYDAFWANPSRASIIWISLLFGIICLAVTTSDVAEAGPGYERDLALRQVDLYVEKIVQCLVLGQYTNTGPYVVESLVHYMHIEFAICTDANKDAWFVLALIIKIAMSMGYHRDPSYFAKLTPLQAEMRRRLWATLVQGDILISSQMGMPRMISDSQWDTAAPQNLNDSDLAAELTQLPASRPETEHTSSLGIISRMRILKVVGQITDLTSAVTPFSYAEITRFDGLLRDAQATIPQLLQPRPLSASITDSSQVIMARLLISQIFYKGQIMLHRRFLYLEPPPQEQAAYTYSRRVCLDAALSLLDIQRIMDEETCAAGQLHMMRWRLSSAINHQFLTATMILCSLLHRGITIDRDDEIITALKTSRTIWMRHCGNSTEARKAALTISYVLGRAFGDASQETGGLPLDEVATKGLPWPTDASLNNLDTEMGFDPRQMLKDLVRPDAGVPFQPDVFEGYTPPMMQNGVLSMFSGAQEAPDVHLGSADWLLDGA